MNPGFYADISIVFRGLNFGLSLQLLPNFEYLISEVTSVQDCLRLFLLDYDKSH